MTKEYFHIKLNSNNIINPFLIKLVTGIVGNFKSIISHILNFETSEVHLWISLLIELKWRCLITVTRVVKNQFFRRIITIRLIQLTEMRKEPKKDSTSPWRSRLWKCQWRRKCIGGRCWWPAGWDWSWRAAVSARSLPRWPTCLSRRGCVCHPGTASTCDRRVPRPAVGSRIGGICPAGRTTRSF